MSGIATYISTMLQWPKIAKLKRMVLNLKKLISKGKHLTALDAVVQHNEEFQQDFTDIG